MYAPISPSSKLAKWMTVRRTAQQGSVGPFKAKVRKVTAPHLKDSFAVLVVTSVTSAASACAAVASGGQHSSG
eukprot:scaffold648023_cov26-Prasinocladus_malaysianus.AAC.2